MNKIFADLLASSKASPINSGPRIKQRRGVEIKSAREVKIMRKSSSIVATVLSEINQMVEIHKPSAIVIIPYDNPTGQFLNQNTINEIRPLISKFCSIIPLNSIDSLHIQKLEATYPKEEALIISSRINFVGASSNLYNYSCLRSPHKFDPQTF